MELKFSVLTNNFMHSNFWKLLHPLYMFWIGEEISLYKERLRNGRPDLAHPAYIISGHFLYPLPEVRIMGYIEKYPDHLIL
jgi:hypothetical protein